MNHRNPGHSYNHTLFHSWLNISSPPVWLDFYLSGVGIKKIGLFKTQLECVQDHDVSVADEHKDKNLL